MNLYLLRTSMGEVYYVVADTKIQAVQSKFDDLAEAVLSCEAIATSANSSNIANCNLPKLIIAK